MTSLGSPSSCEIMEADALTPILYVKKEKFKDSCWRSGLEPQEPTLVFLSLNPEQTVTQRDPCLFGGGGEELLHREGVLFQTRHGKHLVAKACLA